ncbi:FAD:protein FMN transferase [Cryobacterium psychrophilum]|uniref:FAD:protein FMN transferase n=2 Tax=Cryobacterium psychrophilum TaxID=41988 RepID=A0A4Y8KT48_9MICO|nr:FAD:protein FMN transferase [Cryobacterium psychrophilum]
MGTMVSIRFAGDVPGSEILAGVERVFHGIDVQFSLYRAESEISRVARGELALTATSELFRETYARAIEWRRLTNDAFTPYRPDGVIDLSGLVKADAIEAAGTVLVSGGEVNWVLNAGGDVLSCGDVAGEPWSVGIVDPDDRSGLLGAMPLSPERRAMATSGTAERGEHVWRSDRSSRYRQVTVVAADIVTADVLATTVLAGGEQARDDVLSRFDVDLLTVDLDGGLTATPMLRQRR